MKQVIDNWVNIGVLEGRKVKLVPATLEHLNDLAEELLTPYAWPSVHWGIVTRADLQRKIIDQCTQAQEEGSGCGFAMVIKEQSKAVGMSCYLNLKRDHYTLEIGSTWIGRNWQKSFVNTEAKLLMLTDAFERIGCQRVEFRVDALNFNSQRAVLRLGAKCDGELRNGVRLPDGRKRDYKLYSVIDSEWPNIKRHLQLNLDRYV